jgi:hypothetical protein
MGELESGKSGAEQDTAAITIGVAGVIEELSKPRKALCEVNGGNIYLSKVSSFIQRNIIYY